MIEAVIASHAGGISPPPQTATKALLSVQDLSISFRVGGGWLQMLDKVSFDIKPGETVGVVGESGSGKSITAMSILGLLPPRDSRVTGRILFEGLDLASLSDSAMRKVRGRRISMVFQEPMSALDPVFTIGDQIAETVRVHFRVPRHEAWERAIAALDAVGIASPRSCAELYPKSLSGGMRQRVMIAMALVCEPQLLVADEPTTALDVTIQAQIVDLLVNLGQRTGTAIMFITHNLGLVAESCERVLTMYAGQIIEDGKVGDVLSHPLHPYTEGLLKALPHGQKRKTALNAIPGRVPSPHDMPEGCRFQPRCGYDQPVCLQPQDFVKVERRQVRCCRATELALHGAAA